jgi:CheY-like chemotaxis protein
MPENMKPWTQGYRTLFVDDDRLWGRLFIKWFGQHTNYTVAHTFNADEALAYLDGNDIDLVVTNVRMPGMDGIEITKVITDRFDTKVVVYTAGNFPGERQQILDNGALAYLSKPMSMDALTAAIVKVVENNLDFIGKA